MSLISVILALAIAGFLCYLLLLIPMQPIFKNVAVGIIVFFLIIWVLQAFGVSTGLPRISLK